MIRWHGTRIVCMIMTVLFAQAVIRAQALEEAASNLPEETQAYVEVRDPGALLEEMGGARWWPMAEALIRMVGPGGLFPESGDLAVMFREAVLDGEVRSLMDDLMGQRLIVAAWPGENGFTLWMACRGWDPNHSLDALEALALRYHLGLHLDPVRRIGSLTWGGGSFQIWMQGEWTVLCSPDLDGSLRDGLLGSLAEGRTLESSLADTLKFSRLMGAVPPVAPIRAFLDVDAFRESMTCEGLRTCLLVQAIQRWLEPVDAIFATRDLDAQCVAAHVKGCFDPGARPTGLAGVLTALHPTSADCLQRVPRTVFARYALGADGSGLLGVISALADTVWPGASLGVNALLGQAERATGVAFRETLEQCTAPGLLLGLLPGQDREDESRPPSAFAAMPVTDPDPLRRDIPRLLQWLAGFVGPHTEGMLSADVDAWSDQGVDFWTFRMERPWHDSPRQPVVALTQNQLLIGADQKTVQAVLDVWQGRALEADPLIFSCRRSEGMDPAAVEAGEIQLAPLIQGFRLKAEVLDVIRDIQPALRFEALQCDHGFEVHMELVCP